ncbi:MAG: hypothetical protein ACKVPX_15650 [Myxococcaceae bacterium]
MSAWMLWAVVALGPTLGQTSGGASGQVPGPAPELALDAGEPSDAEVIAHLELLEALPEVEAFEVYEALREEVQESSKPPAERPPPRG